MSSLEGATQGALTSPGNRLQGAAVGAVSNPILGALGRGFGKLVQGVNRTPEAQTLINQGVQLPAGMMSPSGAVNKVEQAMTHLPILGSKISNARAAVPAQITQRMFSDAAAPGASVSAGAGLNDAVSQLQSGYDAAYGQAVGGYPAKAAILRVAG